MHHTSRHVRTGDVKRLRHTCRVEQKYFTMMRNGRVPLLTLTTSNVQRLTTGFLYTTTYMENTRYNEERPGRTETCRDAFLLGFLFAALHAQTERGHA